MAVGLGHNELVTARRLGGGKLLFWHFSQAFLDALAKRFAGSTIFGARFFKRVFVSGIKLASRG